MKVLFSALAAAAVLILWRKQKTDSRLFAAVFLVAMAGFILALLTALAGPGGSLSGLKKNASGEGSRPVTLEARVEDRQMEVTVTVPEKPYTDEAAEEWFVKIKEALPDLILGENTSLTHVDRDLVLRTEYEGFPVTLQWYSSDYGVIDDTGAIRYGVSPSGSRVRLSVTLALQEKSEEHFINIRVFPRNGGPASAEELSEALEQVNAGNSGPEYTLPDTIGGQEVTWREKGGADPAGLSFLALVAAILLLFNGSSRKLQQARKREAALAAAYPNLVSSLLLFLYAGINTRQAFLRIANHYLKKKKTGENRTSPALEEVVKACRDMERGISEEEAYGRFAARTGLPSYRTLAVLLSQNLKKGSTDLAAALERECTSAFEERKRRAREAGDRASLQLLLPMGMMLLVVLAIMLLPAFLTM